MRVKILYVIFKVADGGQFPGWVTSFVFGIIEKDCVCQFFLNMTVRSHLAQAQVVLAQVVLAFLRRFSTRWQA